MADRCTKAIEQLGPGELEVRLGGIYAPERIACDSPRDHPTVLEVLAAFANTPTSHGRSNTSPTDGDDNFCFPGSEALLVHVNGCTDTNTGFDGVSYQRVWPDGNTAVHPQPWLFSSPLTGPNYNVNYTRTAFEADLPAIETNTCNRTTGAGCTLIPTTDDGQPAAFYPFFSTLHGNGQGHGCLWAFGNDLPGATTDFGRNAQYGTLLSSTYLAFGGGGSTVNFFNNFRQILPNPCTAGGRPG